jgi:hypothetical protein
MKTVYDLRQHSSLDLARLEMALDTGVSQCGDYEPLREMKETLLAYKLIVLEAHKIAAKREVEEMTQKELAKIISSN